jgi:hypothetical protein
MEDDLLLFYKEPSKKIKTEKLDTSKITPWLHRSTLKLKNPLAKMHNEIIEFYKYITPT